MSEGNRALPVRRELPGAATVRVGSLVPGAPEPLRVRKIDTREGATAPEADPSRIATLWAVRETSAQVPVSIVEGNRTVPSRLSAAREEWLSVGEERSLKDGRIVIVALRARGHTYRRPGDRFRAAEIVRVYARRTERPPAGRRDWSTERGTPSSRTSSISRSARSRSAPGARRTRMAPRRRTASGGATVQRVSPA